MAPAEEVLSQHTVCPSHGQTGGLYVVGTLQVRPTPDWEVMGTLVLRHGPTNAGLC